GLGHFVARFHAVIRVLSNKVIIQFKFGFVCHVCHSRLRGADGAPYSGKGVAGTQDFINDDRWKSLYLSIVGSLVLVFAQIFDPATAATRFARLAYIAAMQNQPM